MYIRKYIDVIASFDIEGRVTPLFLVWEDGRKFPVDRVRDLRPAMSMKAGGQGDRYTISVLGHDRYLFFEHSPRPDDTSPGKWFVEAEARQ